MPNVCYSCAQQISGTLQINQGSYTNGTYLGLNCYFESQNHNQWIYFYCESCYKNQKQQNYGNQQVPILNTQIGQLKTQIEQFNKQLDEKNNQIQSINSQKSSKDTQISTLNTQIAQQKSQIDQLNKKIIDQDQQISNQKQIHSTSIIQLNSEIDELKIQIENKNKQIQDISEQKNDIKLILQKLNQINIDVYQQMSITPQFKESLERLQKQLNTQSSQKIEQSESQINLQEMNSQSSDCETCDLSNMNDGVKDVELITNSLENCIKNSQIMEYKVVSKIWYYIISYLNFKNALNENSSKEIFEKLHSEFLTNFQDQLDEYLNKLCCKMNEQQSKVNTNISIIEDFYKQAQEISKLKVFEERIEIQMLNLIQQQVSQKQKCDLSIIEFEKQIKQLIQNN